MKKINKYLIAPLFIIMSMILSGCNKESKNAKQPIVENQALENSIVIKHQLGDTVIKNQPKRIAALDMNEVDFLDQINVPITGMPKDYIPHFLEKYKNNSNIKDLGALVEPNIERVYAMKPDLILITSLHANHYSELSEIAPTIHFDVDYKNGKNNYFDVFKNHLTDLGNIFNKQDLVKQKILEIENELENVKKITANRLEKALILMHNNGSFSAFGIQSRYGFIYDILGVKPTSADIKSSPHGQPVSSEFIQKINPDIIYIIDRTAVMDKKSVITAEQIYNPLISQTNAWKNNKVIFVDPDAWYTTAASITSLRIIMNDIVKGYEK